MRVVKTVIYITKSRLLSLPGVQRENGAEGELRKVVECRPHTLLRTGVRLGIPDGKHGRNDYVEVGVVPCS